MEQREGFSLEEAEAWVRRAMDDSGEDRKYAIVVEGHEEPVGFTALYGLFRQTAPELGALIGDEVRGKGVGRRAEALTIAKAFDEFGAHRVYGRIPARNEVAKKTVAGLGWKHEETMRAHLRRDGEPADDSRSGPSSPTSSAPPPRTCWRERIGARPRRGRLGRADRGPRRGRRLATTSSARARSSTPKASPTRCASRRRGRAAGPADRPRDPGHRRARRDLPLRLPGPG